MRNRGKSSPNFPDKKKSEDKSFWEILELAEQRQTQKKGLKSGQLSATVRLPGKKNIAVFFLGDTHIGSLYTKNSKLRDYIKLILDNEDVYVVLMGDEVDNFFAFRNLLPVHEQVLDPIEQIECFGKLVEELEQKKKLLATVWDNHFDERTEKALGYSLRGVLLKKQKAPHLEGAGVVNLKVGKVNYKILLTHKAKHSSEYNPNHGAAKMHAEIYPADTIATAHRHEPAYQVVYKYPLASHIGDDVGGKRVFVQTGSFNIDDPHSARNFKISTADVPAVIYSGVEKWMHPMSERPDKILDYLKYLNK